MFNYTFWYYFTSLDLEQLGESQKRKKLRISWKNERVVKTFLEACILEVSQNGPKGASLHASSWKKVGEKLKTNHNLVADQKQMKNHYDYLKAKYKAWSNLKNKSPDMYDPLTNTFNFTEDEWKIEMKVIFLLDIFFSFGYLFIYLFVVVGFIVL